MVPSWHAQMHQMHSGKLWVSIRHASAQWVLVEGGKGTTDLVASSRCHRAKVFSKAVMKLVRKDMHMPLEFPEEPQNITEGRVGGIP